MNNLMLGSKGILPLMPADFSAFCAHENLKALEIRPNRASFSCFPAPKVIKLHTGMHGLTFLPWHHNILLYVIRAVYSINFSNGIWKTGRFRVILFYRNTNNGLNDVSSWLQLRIITKNPGEPRKRRKCHAGKN